MNENTESAAETSINSKDGFQWQDVGFDVTPIERYKLGSFVQNDTPVLSSEYDYFYDQSSLEEGTKLNSEHQDEVLSNYVVFDVVAKPSYTEDKQLELDSAQKVYEQEKRQKVKDISERRIVLLARKYASSQFSPEESARLDILNEMIQRIMPSVTDGDIRKMEDLSSRLEKISNANIEIRKKYGLDND